MTKPHIWLRAETKPFEERTPLTPAGAKQMLDAGFDVSVEDCASRIMPTNEYEEAGCTIVPTASWVDAPRDAFVLGLKELPDDDFPLVHRHIYFAHVYKAQTGAEHTLRRFVDGGGTLYDLEFLLDDSGRRVAAFGYWAGYCGAALGVMAWAHKAAGISPPLASLSSRSAKDLLLDDIRQALAEVDARPRVIVIGAKGRSGRGAVELAQALQLETVEWDMAETRKGGPFEEINDADVFVNCVFVGAALPPFVTMDSLARPGRRLSVISDVSCDPYGSYNPVPIYDRTTTFESPTIEIAVGDAPLHLIAIDHLPSLLPRESSDEYGGQLLPVLRELKDATHPVWARAAALFAEKTQDLRQGD